VIKKANTTEDKQKCFDFIREFGFTPSTDYYLYSENACAGLELSLGDTTRIGRIEPFVSRDRLEAVRLYEHCEGVLRGLGCTHIICVTNKAELIKELEDKENYKSWSTGMEHIIKELN
jgi:hypothetical protein